MSQTVTKLHLVSAQPRRQSWLALVRHRIAIVWQDGATRRALRQLDDRALSDIGISRAQAQFEAEQPVWSLVPGNHR